MIGKFPGFAAFCAVGLVLSAATANARNPAGPELDAHLIQELILHNRHGLALLQVCALRAGNADLIGHCRTALESTRLTAAGLATLGTAGRSYREDGHGRPAAPAAGIPAPGGLDTAPPDMRDRQRHENLDRHLLQVQGGAFDEPFLVAMIQHHRDGLQTTGQCQDSASRSDLKQLCRRLATDEEQGMARLQAWHRAWFGGWTKPAK